MNSVETFIIYFQNKDGVLSEMWRSTRTNSPNDNDGDEVEEICVKFHGFRLQHGSKLSESNNGLNFSASGAHWHRIA